METVVETLGTGSRNGYGLTMKFRPKPEPKPDARGIYAVEDAAGIKKRKVEVRRKNEDIREKMRVPSYFIEDDEGDDDVKRWEVY